MSILSPIIVGLCIAFVINQLLRPVEQAWTWLWRKSSRPITQKLKRPVCLVLSTILIFGIVFAIFFIVVPELGQTFSSLVDMTPSYLKKISEWFENLSDLADNFGIVLPELKIDTDKIMDALKNSSGDNRGFINAAKEFIATSGSMLVNKTVGFTLSIFPDL